jgi:hypothetical protein
MFGNAQTKLVFVDLTGNLTIVRVLILRHTKGDQARFSTIDDLQRTQLISTSR